MDDYLGLICQWSSVAVQFGVNYRIKYDEELIFAIENRAELNGIVYIARVVPDALNK